jgi:calcium-dependent protein kinase
MAPEVLSKKYDEKCDVWSCGIIMYYMLSGSLPFKGKNQKEIFDKVREARVCFTDPLWKEISIQAKVLIKKMLTVNVKERARADEVLNSEWIQQHNKQENEQNIELHDELIKRMMKNIKHI